MCHFLLPSFVLSLLASHLQSRGHASVAHHVLMSREKSATHSLLLGCGSTSEDHRSRRMCKWPRLSPGARRVGPYANRLLTSIYRTVVRSSDLRLTLGQLTIAHNFHHFRHFRLAKHVPPRYLQMLSYRASVMFAEG